MRKAIQIGQKSFAFLMIGIILMIAVGRMFYTHSHVLADGSVITHAHPYDKGDDKPFKSHNHSKNELVVFDTFSFLPTVSLAFTTHLFAKETTIFVPFLSRKYNFICWQFTKERAPPRIL